MCVLGKDYLMLMNSKNLGIATRAPLLERYGHCLYVYLHELTRGLPMYILNGVSCMPTTGGLINRNYGIMYRLPGPPGAI